MLYKTVSLAFAAQAVSGYNMAMPSKIAASRVARAGPVEMAKKSVRQRPEKPLPFGRRKLPSPWLSATAALPPDCRHAL